jgi:hypothetical protein
VAAPLGTLSAVVPTRDTRELTLRCLACLEAGGVPGLEVVVVDEASGDGTAAAVAARFPAVRVVANPRPLGFAAAANRGLAAARGELLLLLNSDAEVDPGALAALVAAFALEPRLGVAGARLRYPDGTPQWSAGREPSPAWLFALASGLPALLARLPGWRRLVPPSGAGGGPGAAHDPLRPAAWVTGAALALRREVWDACGPLDEGYRFYGQDLDLCLAARDAGWRVAVVSGFTAVHHHGATVAGGEPAGDRRRHDLLWADLVRWAAKRRGPAGGRRAADALIWGARLRLAARAAARPWVAPWGLNEWRRRSDAVRAALAAVRAERP